MDADVTDRAAALAAADVAVAVVDAGAPGVSSGGSVTGALWGAVAAVGLSAGWFLASLGTRSELSYLAVVIGLAIGWSVHVGAGRGGAACAAIASGCTAVACIISFYFVARSSLIRRGFIRLGVADQRIPLRPSYTVVRDVLRAGLRGNVAAYVYFVAALVAAAYVGFRGIDAPRAHGHHRTPLPRLSHHDPR